MSCSIFSAWLRMLVSGFRQLARISVMLTCPAMLSRMGVGSRGRAGWG